MAVKAATRHSTKGEIPGNGLIEAGAIVRIGRKVLIDEDRFFDFQERHDFPQHSRSLDDCIAHCRHLRRDFTYLAQTTSLL